MDSEEDRIEILTIIFSSMFAILALIISFIFPSLQILSWRISKKQKTYFTEE